MREGCEVVSGGPAMGWLFFFFLKGCFCSTKKGIRGTSLQKNMVVFFSVEKD